MTPEEHYQREVRREAHTLALQADRLAIYNRLEAACVAVDRVPVLRALIGCPRPWAPCRIAYALAERWNLP